MVKTPYVAFASSLFLININSYSQYTFVDFDEKTLLYVLYTVQKLYVFKLILPHFTIDGKDIDSKC